MRIIPKKIKVKNTVWKCYTMPDVIVALVMFALIFAAITTGTWAVAVILGIVSIVMFMPTQEGIFYACIFENVKFLFAKKRYTVMSKSLKENVDTLVRLKAIKDNGLIEYGNDSFGRVIKIGQKNFGIEDEVQQNIDINYFANALKLIDGNQSADIVKIDRPVNLITLLPQNLFLYSMTSTTQTCLAMSISINWSQLIGQEWEFPVCNSASPQTAVGRRGTEGQCSIR